MVLHAHGDTTPTVQRFENRNELLANRARSVVANPGFKQISYNVESFGGRRLRVQESNELFGYLWPGCIQMNVGQEYSVIRV